MERVRKFIDDNSGIFQQMFIQHKAIMLLIEPETGGILFANQAASSFYGYPADVFQNMSVSDINILPLDEVRSEWMKAVSEERSYFVFQHKLANGETRTVEVYSSPVIINDKSLLYSVIHDISERKKMENRINSLIQEKELILREAHHSIKNNMNAIQSLLALQLDSTGDQYAASVLQIAMSRVKTMTILYEKLHLAHDIRNMHVEGYFSDLIDEILYLLRGETTVRVEKDIADFTLDQHTLFLVGIIVNELLTNIMKYAFSPGMEGIIKFKAMLKDKRVNLEIRDNGRGFPESSELKNIKGFGLQLVTMLAGQIGGNISYGSDNGAWFKLEFPVE